MKIKELVESKSKKIKELTSFIVNNEDGVNFLGNGKEIVHHEAVPLKHSFADQIYVRQMEMKKGGLVVGAIHKHLHVWFLLTGSLTIGNKNEIEDYIAPCYVISEPGAQRVIYANEDSIFVNIHKNPNEIRDIRELEKEWSALTQKEYDEYIKNK